MGATYVQVFSTGVVLFIEKCLVVGKTKIPLIIPESYFDFVGCKIVSEAGVRTITHDNKTIIKVQLDSNLYKAEIKFKVGRGKPRAPLIKGDAGVRCQDFFCEVKHHHPLHTLQERPGKFWWLKKGQAALHLSFAAGNATTFASQLLLAHKMFAHINFKYLRKRASGDRCGPDLQHLGYGQAKAG